MIRAFAVGWLLCVDGGALSPDASVQLGPVLSAEDLEVIRELDLLENLDSSRDLELLQELSIDR